MKHYNRRSCWLCCNFNISHYAFSAAILLLDHETSLKIFSVKRQPSKYNVKMQDILNSKLG